MRGIIAWLGFRQIGVLYERQPRKSGKSKAPFWPTLYFTFNAIGSFSLKPLRLFIFFGFAMVGASALGILIYTLLFLIGSPPQGITTLIVLSLFGIGINSLGIGILGEYLGRTLLKLSRGRFTVTEEIVNMTSSEPRFNAARRVDTTAR